MAAGRALRMIDIGANLTDSMYAGVYHGGKSYHPGDLVTVLNRAQQVGVEKIIVTCGRKEDTESCLDLIENHPQMFGTIGVHPTRCNEMDPEPEAYMEELLQFYHKANGKKENEGGDGRKKIVAVGELGLDYDRLHFCDKETQKKNFEKQFYLAEQTKLPLFLHMRNCCDDFLEIVKKNRHRFGKGVVHSFTGTAEEAKSIIDLDLFIGINGCSLKTQENLDVVDTIPLDKLMIETDAPYCDIRPTHASFSQVKTKWPAKDKKKYIDKALVKGRNEPCCTIQVLEVICGRRGVDVHEAAEQIYSNTMAVFFPDEPITQKKD